MKTSAALKSTGYSLTVCMKFYISIPHAPPFVNRGALTFQNFFRLVCDICRLSIGRVAALYRRLSTEERCSVAVCRSARCGALPPFVNRGALTFQNFFRLVCDICRLSIGLAAALYRRLSTAARCGASLPSTSESVAAPRNKKDGYALAFLQKKRGREQNSDGAF